MPGFVGNRTAFTPSLTADNFTLEGDVAGDYARIRWINWGGELTVSTAYRSWWARPTTAGVGAPTAGEVEFRDRKLGGLSATELRAERRHMQMIFQDPYASLNPRIPVGSAVAEPLKIHPQAGCLAGFTAADGNRFADSSTGVSI